MPSHISSSRVSTLINHLSLNPTAASSDMITVFGKLNQKRDDDIVIVSALRTPIGKAKKGIFKDITPDDMLVAVFKGVLAQTKINPKLVNEIIVGNVQTQGAYSMPARTALFRAGFPVETTIQTLNRQCSSGLQAVASIAADIKAGYIDIGIGAGVESMTNGGNPSDPSNLPPMNLSAIMENQLAKDCLVPMGITSENVAKSYNISRKEQDEFSVQSHLKALKAQSEGKFDKEIVPVNIEGKSYSKDDGPREGTTFEGLSKLKPAFSAEGSTTAGNASQVSDGAAAVLLMKRSKAKELNLPVLGVFRGFKVAGVKPHEMGVGPAVAIPELLKATSVSSPNDVDVYELNEAFASQAVYCVKKLGIEPKRVNPNGGAIALGHPLGCTGSRQVATLLHELNRRKASKDPNCKTGVVSMCIGTGMGAAALFEVE